MAAVAQNPAVDSLRAEIDALRAQLSAARASRDNHHAVLLAHPATTARLRRGLPSSFSSSSSTTASTPRARALRAATRQRRRASELTARLAAGATAFKVVDPDPHAPDGGSVLGVRIDVSVARGAFAPSYYLLLRRSSAPASSSPARARNGDDTANGDNSGDDNAEGGDVGGDVAIGDPGPLALHKHTIPPAAAPLHDLLARHLPPAGEGKQDLHALARALRRGLVAWHRRRDAVAALRTRAGLDGAGAADGGEGPGRKRARKRAVVGSGGIVDVAADAAAREVTVGWQDGVVARVRIAGEGKVEGVVVREEAGEEGDEKGERRREIERAVWAGDGRVEGLIDRILALRAVE